LGLAPGGFGNADVSVHNPPTFNPSQRKATGVKSAAVLARKKQKRLEDRERATPKFNPSKQQATGAPTPRQLTRNKKEQLRKKLVHEVVTRVSKRA
jgi:hypothetical protein